MKTELSEKSKELLRTQHAANAFFNLLIKGQDPVNIIDQMISYYEPLLIEANEQALKDATNSCDVVVIDNKIIKQIILDGDYKLTLKRLHQ